MTKPTKKRELKFENFDEVISEIKRLQQTGYTKYGNWNLSQVCGHLVEWMRYPMDGYPPAPLPIRAMLWVMKVTVGRSMKKKILAGGFTPGMMTAPNTVYKPDDLNEDDIIEKLQSTMDRLHSHNGAFHPSPLFGDTDRQTQEKVQLLHCAHHLGFLEPKAE